MTLDKSWALAGKSALYKIYWKEGYVYTETSLQHLLLLHYYWLLQLPHYNEVVLFQGSSMKMK